MSESEDVIDDWRKVPITGIPWKMSTDYKTGDWRSFRPIIDHDKCTTCLFCSIHCPDASIDVKWKSEEKKVPERVDVDYDYCKGCGICAEVCPVDAIEMVEEGEQ